ncbi:PACS1-like protein [Mya arenaria]|uniref:PACS1-like protein n=1 Tax=Mya arenaria TaxID=6604 RepID=A0ABY7FAB9_MYAAR|nr:PACS1-like protein [Mya arenaria]
MATRKTIDQWSAEVEFSLQVTRQKHKVEAMNTLKQIIQDCVLLRFLLKAPFKSSKRVLRSNEIEIASVGVADYPHFLKRDGNKLQVMQNRENNKELSLYRELKDHKNVVAKVIMLNLSSTPVDHEDVNGRRKMLAASDADRSPDIDADSEEDENEFDQEAWSNDDLSDSEPTMLDEGGPSRKRGVARTKVRPAMNRADHELGDGGNPGDIEDLIEQLEDLSDSEPEMDTMSVMSTPKPRLRPFFTGRGSTNDIDCQSLTEGQYHQGLNSDDSSNSQAPQKRNSHPQPQSMLLKPIQRERSTSYKERQEKKTPRPLDRCNSMGLVDQLVHVASQVE